jgi:UrcA family protein
MIRLVATAVFAAAVLSAGAASASEYRIAIGDLNLATPEGAAAFDLRVRRASLTACVSGSSLDQAQCRREFRNEARDLLPAAQRADYARAREARVVVRTPADPR